MEDLKKMNYKFTKRNTNNFDKTKIKELASNINCSEKLVELLLARGIDTVERIDDFLNPNSSHFSDPFLLKGMKEAVARVAQAIENQERVMVCGDYDADGVSASAIIAGFLLEQGLEVYTHIPNRTVDGYGLNMITLEPIVEEIGPDLVITCDCGITAAKEVAHLLDLGLDVIVTDHHEVDNDNFPECVVVNPKQKDCNYPTDYLCGAGVAFKLVQAIAGLDVAMGYIDICALATIADMVPLTGENRAIVALGLKQENRKSKGLIALLKNQGFEGNVSSTEIAYKIAPRINAAGRMGDAYRAFELLSTDDEERISDLIYEINKDNNNRKSLCDAMIKEALDGITASDIVDTKAIVLNSASWEKGVTGILAAQIAQEFKRPAFIITGSIGACKGTARGASSVNIYELLEGSKDLLLEFGGHSGAAGFSIEYNNISAFKERLKLLLANIPIDKFLPNQEYDAIVTGEDFNLDFIKEIDLLEPFGTGNPRPLLCYEGTNFSITPNRTNYRHSQIMTDDGLQIIAFNNYHNNQFLIGDNPKKILLEFSVDTYTRIEAPKAILRGVSNPSLYVNDLIAKTSYLRNITLKNGANANYKTYAKKELYDIIPNNSYGTLVIAGSKTSYDEFIKNNKYDYFQEEFIFSTNINNYSKIIVSPAFDSNIDLSYYSTIVFLDTPPALGLVSLINKKTEAIVYLPKISNELEFLKGIDVSKESMRNCYEAIRLYGNLSSYSLFSYLRLLKQRIENLDFRTFVFAIAVFNELELIKIHPSPFKLSAIFGAKGELENSSIYNYAKKLLEAGN